MPERNAKLFLDQTQAGTINNPDKAHLMELACAAMLNVGSVYRMY